MANRRNLKKTVNGLCGELFAECVLASAYNENIDKEKVDDLMTQILKVQDDFITRISHTEKGREKDFYKKFFSDFSAAYQKMSDNLNTLDVEKK